MAPYNSRQLSLDFSEIVENALANGPKDTAQNVAISNNILSFAQHKITRIHKEQRSLYSRILERSKHML